MKFTLKCCGKTDPIGVDKLNIRLSFGTDGSMEICSYEIALRETSGGRLIWTAQGVPADGFTAMVDPKILQDAAGYTWQITAKLTDGTTAVSQPAFFETGISQWQAQWIGKESREGRVLAFRREVVIDQPVQKARLYICGLGYFSPRLNGQALDESYFIPPVTDYTSRPAVDQAHISQGHRVSYYTYDVKETLRQGSNELYAEVSGGYFSNQEKLDYEPQPDFSFGAPCLCYELHVQYEDGTKNVFCSGTDTQVRCTHEISQLYSGDRIDFTQPPEPYAPARLVTAPEGVLTSPQCESDRAGKSLTPVDYRKIPEGTIYDFGVNHSGGLRLTVRAREETELEIRFAEVLGEDGLPNFETSAWHGKHEVTGEEKHIYQKNSYRLKKGINTIEPKFSWFCYRYALIPDDPAVCVESIESVFIHMDIPRNGSFDCSEELLNRIHEMFLQTLYCNLHSGLLMDCPHRERLPYTGDGRLVFRSAYYSMDMIPFCYKWFRDILDAQTADGLIPNSAPYMGGGGGYAWGNAVCTVSRLLYELTGDKTAARQGYDAICKWLGYYESKRDENYIIRANSHTWMLGDWLAPYVVTSDVYYISTVCYLQAVKTALFFARLLDADRCQMWENLQSNIIKGIHAVFFHEKTCTYGNGVQGENMLALAENIVPEQYRYRMERELRRHYSEQTQYHLDTGIVLTPVLLEYLTDHGYRDLAWRIMTAKTYPSYFNLMENDTTFSEHWSKKWPDYYFGENGNSRLVQGGGDLSHCHPMYGSVVSWLYERVAGLDLRELYLQKVNIAPCFMDRLDWAKAEKDTAFGKVSVAWNHKDGRYTLTVSVPEGLTAHCHFPATCRSLINTVSNAIYKPDQTGAFQFDLGAGRWILEEEIL